METNKMKKKIFFILLITCILFSVSGVFAGDINDTAVASDETALVGESSDDLKAVSNDENQPVPRNYR